MSFYEELSKYYDVIFPTVQAKVQFLNSRAKEGSKVLDIACGTGNYSIALTDLGHKVDGIDLDDKMIEMAKEKSEAKGLKINFVAGDMREVKDIFSHDKYDLVFCIGNSLVHLQTKEEIEKLFKGINSIMNNGGKLIIQIINYDRILKHNVDFLPEINRQEDGVRFIRKYSHKTEENRIYFNTEIIVQDNEEEKSYTNSIPLLPLQSFELVEIFEKAGFKDIKLYGDFKGSDHSLQSYPTIAVASK